MSAEPAQSVEPEELVSDDDEFADEDMPEFDSRRTPDAPEDE